MDFKHVSFEEFVDSLNNPDLSKTSPIIFFVYESRGLQSAKVILFGVSCTSGTLVHASQGHHGSFSLTHFYTWQGDCKRKPVNFNHQSSKISSTFGA